MKHERSRRFAPSLYSEQHPAVLCGGAMLRLDVSWFYRLGQAVNALGRIRYDVPISEITRAFTEARPWLQQLQDDVAIGQALRGTRASLSDLLRGIDTILSRAPEDIFSFGEMMDLTTNVGRFETVLTSELAVADAYWVMEKKPYSTLALVAEGETLFSPSVRAKIPEAVRDLQEAGRCLAFEVPTAAAFHIHRAVEAVLRRYWEAVTGNAPKPKTRSIGVFLAAMKKLNCGDSKVIAALSQMNELHRNPTIHPEAYLSTEEALALVGIANSVVAAMVRDMPDDNAPALPGLLGALVSRELAGQSGE